MAKAKKSVGEKKREGKLDRYHEALLILLAEDHPAYEQYIRLHRLLFGIDPDPNDVAIPWPSVGDDDG